MFQVINFRDCVNASSKYIICVFFEVPGTQGISVKVFLPDGMKQKAIAFGLRASFTDLQNVASEEPSEFIR